MSFRGKGIMIAASFLLLLAGGYGASEVLELGGTDDTRTIAAFPGTRLAGWTTAERIALFNTADSLGVPIDSLGAVMSIESGFNPAAVNPSSGAAGLIQLTTGAQLPGFGTKDAVAAVAGWSVERQLREVVIPYFQRIPGIKGATPEKLYMAVFMPDLMNADPSTVVGAQFPQDHIDAIKAKSPADRTAAEKKALFQHAVYTQNKAFDKGGKKGFFTVADIQAVPRAVINAAKTKRMRADGSVFTAIER